MRKRVGAKSISMLGFARGRVKIEIVERSQKESLVVEQGIIDVNTGFKN